MSPSFERLMCVCIPLLWAITPGCIDPGGLENGTMLLGPGVFGVSGDGLGWDGTTTLERGILMEVQNAYEVGGTDSVLSVYAENALSLPPPLPTGYVRFNRRRQNLDFYRADTTGFLIQFATNIDMSTDGSLSITMYENRVDLEQPIIDVDLGWNWHDCMRDDTLRASIYEETEYRALWYEAYCIFEK